MINHKRLIQTFLDLVRIDSPSGFEKEISQKIAKHLKRLGGDVTFDNHGNVFAHFKGVGEPFILCSHLDTVEPGRNIQPEVNHDIITSKRETILGGDAKAGVAAI